MESFSDYIVDCKKIKNNALNIKNMLSKNTKFCAIVKANAYGLGTKVVCKTLFGIADFFGVSNIQEALEIRAFDETTPILILGMVSATNLQFCSQNDISISISCFQNLLEVIDFCKKNKKQIKIHLQINTGLNRYGFNDIGQFKRVLSLLRKNKYIKLEGVYSHFATKGQDVDFIYKQFERFGRYRKLFKRGDVIFHMANSFATLIDNNLHLNMVRNGFLLYGGTANDIGNELALTIKSKIVNILDAKPGDTIGYDRLFKVTKPTKIAVVPLGYADGIDRRLSNNFSVLINGQFCPIVGYVCMDVFMVDISNINAKLYDAVVLLGESGDEKITLYDYAQRLKTSPYEALLKFSYRRMNYITK